MTTFAYRAKGGKGKASEGLVEADSRAAALEKLGRQGLFPISLEESGAAGARLGSFERRVPAQDLALFTRQLADLLGSGVPLLKGLRLVAGQTEHPRLGRAAREIVNAVEGGTPLSEALGRQETFFDPLAVSLVRVGETAGALGPALERISDFTEQAEEMRVKVKTALLYPLVIACVGALTVVFLMLFVVPRLAGMFEDMGQSLPLVTRMLFGASGALLGPGGIVLLAASPILWLGLRRLSSTGAAGALRDRVLFHIPAWGNVARKVAVARFARTLATLLTGGVSILDALKTSADAAGHGGFREQVLGAAELVRGGAGLAESLRRQPDFPPFLCHMIAVGEEGNILEKSLQKVAATYEREADRAMKIFASLLEPVMIVAVGCVIGLIVIALLLPIFEMSTFVK